MNREKSDSVSAISQQNTLLYNSYHLYKNKVGKIDSSSRAEKQFVISGNLEKNSFVLSSCKGVTDQVLFT